jgi:Phosphotransferase enzyme family
VLDLLWSAVGTEPQEAAERPPVPLPPQDPALGPVSLALDGEGVTDLLNGALADCAAGRVLAVACRPVYLRYSPGRYYRVLYDVGLRDAGTGAVSERLAHAALLRGDRAERLWSRGEPQRLAERASELHPGPPDGRAAFVPALRAIVQVYPVDLDLPGLVEAASPETMRERLRTALPEGGELRAVTPELVRYKPRRRVVLRLGLQGGERTAAYAKVRADERGALIHRSAGALAAAGVPLPDALAYLPDLRLMLAAEAEGTRLKELRGSARFGAAMEPVAEVLTRLHACRIPDLPEPGLGAEAGELRAAAATVAALLPGARARIERLAERLIKALAAIDVPVGTIHGSFHDDQVLVSEAGPTLVDLDSVQAGPLLADVGHFLSYLSAEGADAAREEFLGAYARTAATGPSVLPFEAAALLRWSTLPFRALEPDWPEAVERRVELAEARLADYEASAAAGA